MARYEVWGCMRSAGPARCRVRVRGVFGSPFQPAAGPQLVNEPACFSICARARCVRVPFAGRWRPRRRRPWRRRYLFNTFITPKQRTHLLETNSVLLLARWLRLIELNFIVSPHVLYSRVIIPVYIVRRNYCYLFVATRATGAASDCVRDADKYTREAIIIEKMFAYKA